MTRSPASPSAPTTTSAGERVPSADRFEDRSPIDWAPLAEVARGGQAEVDMAVDAATPGFPAWAALGADRAAPSTCAGSPT